MAFSGWTILNSKGFLPFAPLILLLPLPTPIPLMTLEMLDSRGWMCCGCWIGCGCVCGWTWTWGCGGGCAGVPCLRRRLGRGAGVLGVAGAGGTVECIGARGGGATVILLESRLGL